MSRRFRLPGAVRCGSGLLLGTGLGLLPGSVMAADQPHVLARSSSRHIEVVGDGAPWCQAALSLRMVVAPDSPDTAAAPAALLPLMARLGGPIQAQCPQAASVSLQVVQNDRATGRFVADRAHGWSFTGLDAGNAPTVIAGDLDAQHPATSGPASPGAGSPASAPPATITARVPPVAEQSSAPAASAPAAAGTPPAVASGNTAATPPSAAPAPLDGYAGLALRLMHDDPALLQNEDMQKWWASQHDAAAYGKSRGDDFAMHGLLLHAVDDMQAQIASHDLSHLLLDTRTELGEYRFASHDFPISVTGQDVSVQNPRCCFGSGVVSSIPVHVDGLDAISGIPMGEDAAHDLIGRRKTAWGFSNRTVFMQYLVRLDDGPMRTRGYQKSYSGRVVGATVYDDANHTVVLAVLDAAAVGRLLDAQHAAAAAVEQQRAAEQQQQRMQQMAQQRQFFVQAARNWSPEQRIAALLPSSNLYGSARLDTVRSLRASSVMSRGPAEGILLFQTAGSGDKDVSTRWPGHLHINPAAGGGTLQSGRWYVASGTLTAAGGPTLRDAAFLTHQLHACQQDQCAESSDPAFLVDRKITTSPDAAGATP